MLEKKNRSLIWKQREGTLVGEGYQKGEVLFDRPAGTLVRARAAGKVFTCKHTGSTKKDLRGNTVEMKTYCFSI